MSHVRPALHDGSPDPRPTVAIMQWKNEIEAHTEPPLRVLVWHGAAREADAAKLAAYDVVLTTYAVLESAFRKQVKGFTRGNKIIKERSPVHAVEWGRVVVSVVLGLNVAMLTVS